MYFVFITFYVGNGSSSATNIGGVGGGGNGNGPSSNTNGNGISSSEKLGSLTPSPLTRSAEDVKSEPMELVCPNNNTDEHSNDSTGEHNVHRTNSADCGKGSMRYVNNIPKYLIEICSLMTR